MLKLRLFITVVLVMLLSANTFAQTKEDVKQGSLDSGTISSQFNYMLKKSSRYQDYKVIKVTWLNKFKLHVLDSISALRSEIRDSYTKNDKLDAQIVELKAHVNELQQKLDNSINEKDSMKWLGISVAKSSYTAIMWLLVFGLLIATVVCFMLFRRSNVVTVETKRTLEEVREEFEQHRKNALVREQKLARKLQDEVIKNKNIGL